MSYLPLLSAALAAVSFFLFHWNGTEISPDGWAYWQGAVSFASGHGYRYFSGDPITAWPPGYAIYLSAWISIFNSSAGTLVAANTVLIAAMAAAWTWVTDRLWRERGAPSSVAASAAVACYIGLLCAMSQPKVASEALKYFWIALLMFAAYQLGTSSRTENAARWTLAFAVCGVMALLVHNSSIAVVIAGSAVALIWMRTLPWMPRLAFAALAALVPLAAWAAVRAFLDQGGSHAIGFGLGRFRPAAYVMHALFGAGELAGGTLVSWPPLALLGPALAIAIVWRPLFSTASARFAYVLAASAAALTFLLFNLTWLSDPLGVRFVVFVPLMIVPPAILAAPRRRLILVLVLTLVPVVAATVMGIRHVIITPIAERGFPEAFVPLDAYISPDYRTGAPQRTGEGLLVAPIAWEEPRSRTR